MFNDDHRVAVVAQAVQHSQQQVDVVEVQAGGRLVEYVQGTSGVALGEFERQFDALRFAARQRGRALAERDVTETDVEQRMQFACDNRHRAEKFRRLLDRHRQHLRDAFTFVLNFERLAVVALAAAHIAGHVDIGQEVHLDFEHAVALAGFAAPAFDVERKTSRAVAALARHRHAGKQLADRREKAGVGGGIGTRCAADRALIDVDDLVEMFEPIDGGVRGRFGGAAIEMARRRAVEGVVDQRGFSRARNAGDADEKTDRHVDGNVFQIIAARAFDVQQAIHIGFVAQSRHFDAAAPRQILTGQRFGIVANVIGCALRDDASAVLAGAEADVDDVVGVLDGILIVLDDDHGVADVTQALQRVEQPRVIALVQADRRFVEHVHHAGESRPDLACQPDALCFAAGQRVGGTVKRQVVEPDVVQERDAVDDFLDDAVGDRQLVAWQLDRRKKCRGLLERECADFVNRLAGDLHVARFAAQARAFAFGASLAVQILGELLAHHQ